MAFFCSKIQSRMLRCSYFSLFSCVCDSFLVFSLCFMTLTVLRCAEVCCGTSLSLDLFNVLMITLGQRVFGKKIIEVKCLSHSPCRWRIPTWHQLVKVLSAKFLHWKVTVFLLFMCCLNFKISLTLHQGEWGFSSISWRGEYICILFGILLKGRFVSSPHLFIQ